MAETPAENLEESRFTVAQVALAASGGFVAAVLIVFGIAVWLALTHPEAVAIVQIIRDVLVIALALQGILIIIAIAVLVVQIARFINLLKTEFRIILESMQATVKEAQTTAEFVSANAIGPLIRISTFFTGLATFFKELADIRRAIRPKRREPANGTAPNP